MLSKKLQDIAHAIERSRYKSADLQYQLGIAYVAHAIADDQCTGQERYHFLLMCGVTFQL